MSEREDRLYKLLPYVYQEQDAQKGFPLRELLRVIAEQVNLIEEDIAQLYDNWFIETAEDWVIPYIGDLVGYESAYEAGEPGDVKNRAAQQRQRIVTPRADVANTLHYRRQRGTLAVLEELAQVVAEWPARAVEFYRLTGITQPVKHLNTTEDHGKDERVDRGRTVDVRQGNRLVQINGPFDQTAHTADARSINSTLTTGRYNLSNLGLFVWRLQVRQIKQTPAALSDEKPNHFTFSILGNDVPLFLRAQPENGHDTIAGEWNLPVPLRRRAMERWQKQKLPDGQSKLSAIYGPEEGKSLAIWAVYESRHRPTASRRKEKETVSAPTPVLIECDQIQIADLSTWQYVPPNPKGKAKPKVMVDPELGRIAFPEQPVKDKTLVQVQVMYHYAQCDDVGGGTYPRLISDPLEPFDDELDVTKARPVVHYTVRQKGKHGNHIFPTLRDALDCWQSDSPQTAVIEIADSGIYEDPLQISMCARQNLYIRAADQERPVIILSEHSRSRLDALQVDGEQNSRLTLDGLLIAGRAVRIQGYAWAEDDTADAPDERALSQITLRNCTLVPGWMPAPHLYEESTPLEPEECSLELLDTGARVTIDHCILGTIHVEQNEVLTDPILIEISDSIIDAAGEGLEAIEGRDERPAHAVLRVERSTVIGNVYAHSIELAENSIFDGKVRVARRQYGCMRFCWYDASGSRVPRRFNCQPDLAEAALQEKAADNKPTEIMLAQERQRLRPRFVSKKYGNPSYCQLANDGAVEIRTGADDESEIGVYHDLYEPQRAANLRARLDAFVPAGVNAAIVFAS